MTNQAFVYAIVVGGVTRYVGKGRKGRFEAHLQIARTVLRHRSKGKKPRVSKLYDGLAASLALNAEIKFVILIDGLSDKEAFDREIVEIAKFQPAQLWNISPGGEGFTSETASKIQHALWDDSAYRERQIAVFSSLEYRAKVSTGVKAKIASDPDYRRGLGRKGVKKKPAQAAKIAAKARDRWANPEFLKHMKQINSTPEGRAKRSYAARCRWDRHKLAESGNVV
jgi:hypothetical protein